MKWISFSQIPKNKHRQIFRTSVKHNPYFLIPVVLILVGIFQLSTHLFFKHPLVSFGAGGALLVFTTLLYFKFFYNTLSMTPWALILEEKGVYVNVPARPFSSAGKSVFFIPLHEIKSVQKTHRTAVAEGFDSSGKTLLNFTFLDISLYNPVVELNSNPEDIQKNNHSEKHDIATLFQNSRSLQITLRNPSTIRIRFDNLSSSIISAILYFSQNQICVSEDGYEEVSSSNKEQSQMEKVLAQLVIEGDQASAVRLAQKIYGLGKSDATQLVRQINMSVENC